jgi:hypothetical protein
MLAKFYGKPHGTEASWTHVWEGMNDDNFCPGMVVTALRSELDQCDGMVGLSHPPVA